MDDAERSSGNLFMKEIKEVGYYCKCFENELFCINILKNGGATLDVYIIFKLVKEAVEIMLRKKFVIVIDLYFRLALKQKQKNNTLKVFRGA